MSDPRALYGVLGEFETPEALIEAAKRARTLGYSQIDAFTPFPVEELNAILQLRDSRVRWLGLLGGFTGAVLALGMQVYVNADFPLNVGGRPLFAWPAFAVVTFELTILFAASFAVIGMLALNGLPRLYHPVFNASRFGRASRDRFFLCIEARDAIFDAERVTAFLRDQNAASVELVDE